MFDTNGSITSKSDFGATYSYNTPNKPNAVSDIATSPVDLPNAQNLSFTSFEKAGTVSEGAYSAEFVYNAEYDRAKMIVKNNNVTFLIRLYAGSRYMKETLNGTDSQYTYLGGDAYSAPVVAVTTGGSTIYYYLIRDYLGNITHVYNASNSTTREYSYDAWGRRRNATDWSYDLTGQPELLADRGFTSHEHLPWFNLINMNGRLYDPLVGAFVSPDPKMQASDNTQGMNRYTYCMNNPLLYVDQSGYTWFGSFFRWTGKSVSNVIGTAGKLAAWAVTLPASTIDALHNGDWSRLDPFSKGTISNNCYQITHGLFQGSPLQILSRFTWELPQTIAGFVISQGDNYFGRVRNIDNYGGTTVLQSYSERWGAFTVGNYIIGDRSIEASPYNVLFQHEYGHYLQSQSLGFTYSFKVALPSLIDAWINDQSTHERAWFEKDANARALNYWKSNIPGFTDNNYLNDKGEFASGIHAQHLYDYMPFYFPLGDFLFNIQW